MAVLHDKLVVSPILVGRSNEVQALHVFIERAKGGQGQTAFIFGEAGSHDSFLKLSLMP